MAHATLSCTPQVAEFILTTATTREGGFGPAYMGVPASALVYGITCCQAYCYFQSERAGRDPLFLKISIAILVLATTIQQAFIVHAMYYYLVQNFGNPCTLLERVVWSLPADLALNCPVQMVVGGFLVYKTWKLSHDKLVSTICALLVLAAAAMNLLFSLQFFSLTPFEIFIKLRAFGIAAFGVFAIADTCTSMTLVYYLYRNRSGIKSSDSIIARVIKLMLSSNALTMLTTIGGLIAYVVGTHGFYVSFFVFVIDKLYLSSMLSVLILRDSLKMNISEPMSLKSVHSYRLSRVGRGRYRTVPIGTMEINFDRIIERGDARADSPTLPQSPVDLVPLSSYPSHISRFSHGSYV